MARSLDLLNLTGRRYKCSLFSLSIFMFIIFDKGKWFFFCLFVCFKWKIGEMRGLTEGHTAVGEAGILTPL